MSEIAHYSEVNRSDVRCDNVPSTSGVAYNAERLPCKAMGEDHGVKKPRRLACRAYLSKLSLTGLAEFNSGIIDKLINALLLWR